MALYPFTPSELPTWALIGVIIAAVVGVPLFLGGIGMYVWEGVSGRRKNVPPQKAPGDSGKHLTP